MFFDCDGVKLYYEVKGDPNGKQTIAFFNGVMASTNSWDLLVPTLTKFGFKIICHDFKGQMKSDKPKPNNEKGIYSFKEHAMEAKKLFEYLGVDKAHICGTSYGGEVGMKFASMFPEMVCSLTVIDSVSELDEVCKNFVVGWKALCDIGDGETFFWGMAPSIYGGDFMKENMDMLEKRAKAFKQIDSSYYVGQKILYDTFTEDVYMTNELDKITCPTLIVCGEEDILKPPKFSDIIYKHIKNCEFVTFPHCGHVTIFEKPKELNSVLLGFLMKNIK